MCMGRPSTHLDALGLQQVHHDLAPALALVHDLSQARDGVALVLALAPDQIRHHRLDGRHPHGRMLGLVRPGLVEEGVVDLPGALHGRAACGGEQHDRPCRPSNHQHPTRMHRRGGVPVVSTVSRTFAVTKVDFASAISAVFHGQLGRLPPNRPTRTQRRNCSRAPHWRGDAPGCIAPRTRSARQPSSTSQPPCWPRWPTPSANPESCCAHSPGFRGKPVFLSRRRIYRWRRGGRAKNVRIAGHRQAPVRGWASARS